MAIQWTPDLAVGIDEIDKQHQGLFKAADDLLEAMRQGKGKAEMGKLLQFLESYVVEHFGLEEKTMQELGYAAFLDHKREHDAFIKDFARMKASYEAAGANTSLVIEINNKVCSWLRTHIGRTDRTLAIFLQTKKWRMAR